MGEPGSARGPPCLLLPLPIAAPPAWELSWLAAGVGLGEEGGGQGGGLPSWKRPCLIVPD